VVSCDPSDEGVLLPTAGLSGVAVGLPASVIE
jgi:hypothetical protein